MPSPSHPVVYQGPLLRVERWEQLLPNGTTAPFERCIRPDSVAVIPFLNTETVLLTQERQPGRSQAFIDVPGGRVDEGETAEQAARRELLEETGYEALHLFPWHTTVYAGIVSFQHTLFIATGLSRTETSAQHDASENITILPSSCADLYERCLTNGLRRTEVMLAVLQMHHNADAKQRLKEILASLNTP